MSAPAPASLTALASVDATAWGCVDFLSDVHLHSADAPTAQAWLDYVAHTPAQALFILGDLFEAWVGDDVLQHPLGAFEQSCAQALAACAQRIPVFFVCGNRDFLIGPGFLQHTGVQALAEPCTVRSSAGVLLLSHGDNLCTDDHDYLAFRAQVRDWLAGQAKMAKNVITGASNPFQSIRQPQKPNKRVYRLSFSSSRSQNGAKCTDFGQIGRICVF